MNLGKAQRKAPAHLTEAESHWLTKPASLSIFALTIFLIGEGILQNLQNISGGYSSIIVGCLIFGLNNIFYFVKLKRPDYFTPHQNKLAIIDGIFFGIGLWIVPEKNTLIIYSIIILVALISIVLWEKTSAFIFILVSIGISILLPLFVEQNLPHRLFLERVNFTLMAIILVESVSRLTRTMRARIERLETINEFAHKIATSIEAEEVVKAVNQSLQKAIQADTYYLGIYHEDGKLFLPLLYDDGEYFSNQFLSIEGTLSGWVIENQKNLFLPDLRQDTDLEGVRQITVGKERTSLAWLGVPFVGAHLKGILAIASYKPNAFSRTDMELLENLAQQTVLALDNAYHHEEVEKQARLDSLTQVYNHGYFLKILAQEAQKSQQNNTSMSIIMLDIDHFKQYNDNYGHLAGDLVLVKMAQIISDHLKRYDSVGRWGGEEFCILLPQTSKQEACQIALRIQEKINNLQLTSEDGQQLPLPTISQGIATYPYETNQTMKLVEIADKRLYLAKERGRNQIEDQARID